MPKTLTLPREIFAKFAKTVTDGIDCDDPDWPGLEFGEPATWRSLEGKLKLASGSVVLTDAEARCAYEVFDVMSQNEDWDPYDDEARLIFRKLA